MERLATRRALRAGALGVSTSRTPLHRSADGELVPGTDADEAEIMALGDALRAAGHGVFQGALHHPDVPASFGWMRRAGPALGPAGHVQLPADRRRPRPVARGRPGCSTRPPADGIEVYGQVHGRPVGVLMGWSATIHPFSAKPSWGQLAFMSPADRVAALRRPELRAALVAERAGRPGRRSPPSSPPAWHKMFPFRGETDYEPPRRRVGRRHRRAGGPGPGRGGLRPADRRRRPRASSTSRCSTTATAPRPLWELHQHPRTRMGLADGGAHVGSICDGSTPSFMVAFWTRDRVRGPHLPARR